jgi:acyl carrier protein
MVNSSNQQNEHSIEKYSQEEIEEWITIHISELKEIGSHEVEKDVPFYSYSLDSSDAINMAGDLEEWLGKELNATLFYDYPTITILAAHLSEG